MPEGEPPPGARGAPGWAAARFDETGIVEAWVSGIADLEAGAPVTRETPFRWFSITKLVTAMTVLSLVDEGEVSLDDPIDRFLPWVGASPARTVRQLLSHSAGMAVPNPIGWAHPPGARLRSSDELTREVHDALREKHRAPSATDARYSNLGYLLLGQLVEAVRGEPFEREVTERTLPVLDLSGASFDPRGAAVGHERLLSIRALAMSLLFFPRTSRLIRYARDGWIGLAPYQVEGAAYGGLIGSLDDLVTLGRILLEPRWARMHEPHAVGPEGRFGLGPWLYEGGWLGHGGSAGGYRAELMVHPARRIGVAALANAGDAGVLEVVRRIRAAS